MMCELHSWLVKLICIKEKMGVRRFICVHVYNYVYMYMTHYVHIYVVFVQDMTQFLTDAFLSICFNLKYNVGVFVIVAKDAPVAMALTTRKAWQPHLKAKIWRSLKKFSTNQLRR